MNIETTEQMLRLALVVMDDPSARQQLIDLIVETELFLSVEVDSDFVKDDAGTVIGANHWRVVIEIENDRYEWTYEETLYLVNEASIFARALAAMLLFRT